MNGYNERKVLARQYALQVAEYHLNSAIDCGAPEFALKDHKRKVESAKRALSKAEKEMALQ